MTDVRSVLTVWTLLFAFSISLAQGLGIDDELLAWIESEYGGEARLRVLRWQDLMRTPGAQDDDSKLKAVNAFFNRVPYGTDQELWQRDDYWATPIEMLGIRGADCEDYAIAKYLTLREMGVAAERMRIIYVKALTLDQAHMVLAYYPQPDTEPYILDNLDERIVLASQRQDLVPVYSFNGDGLWVGVNLTEGRRVGGAGRIKHWRGLLEKLKKENNR